MRFNDLHLVGRVKIFAALLRRVTPNQTAVAETIGISRPLMSMYCNAEDPDHNFPAALIPYHPEAHEILDTLARELGYEVVERPQTNSLNGEIVDERDQIMVLLGRITEIEQKASRAAGHHLTRHRAQNLRAYATELRRIASQMEDELDEILREHT